MAPPLLIQLTARVLRSLLSRMGLRVLDSGLPGILDASPRRQGHVGPMPEAAT